MKYAAVGAALLALVIVPVAVAKPAKPKPWAWTTAQAGQHVDGKCRGVGKPVAKHWVAFSCTVDGSRAWVKVRPRGKGGACLSAKSLAAVSATCLKARGLVPLGEPTHDRQTPEGEIQKAMTARFVPESTIPWQTFSRLDCLGADGFYECSFTSAVSGTAYVLYRASSARVIWTSLACTGAYEGRPECSP